MLYRRLISTSGYYSNRVCVLSPVHAVMVQTGATWPGLILSVQYCHFVAGLVGIGLSQLFSASQLEDPEVGRDTELANSMGIFLQKTNIIRDYFEDTQVGRAFWPEEVRPCSSVPLTPEEKASEYLSVFLISIVLYYKPPMHFKKKYSGHIEAAGVHWKVNSHTCVSRKAQ